MSKAVAATPADERLSLGQSALSSSSKPLHSLPNIASALPPDGTSQPTSSAGLVSSDVLSLATPPPRYVDSQAWHLLATEMVYTLVQSSRHVSQKQRLARHELSRAGIPTEPPPSAAAAETDERSRLVSGSAELEAMISARLEAIGFHVGANMAEHLSRERVRFAETLDVLKFVCKELWTTVWGKQVDNLRTNHRGVYVLQDNAFRPLGSMSTPRGVQQTAREMKLFLSYPVGIVRGALAQLDVPSVVVAETSQAPQCTFHVKTQRAGAAFGP